MGIIKEFKEFAVKGNVVDLAVAVIIGVAFGAVITSLVNDVIMPPIGLALGGVDFNELKYVLKEAQGDVEEVAIRYGQFIQILINFILIAFIIFLLIKGINRLKKKAEDPKNPEAPTPKDIELLAEIRDILKNRS